MLDAVGSFQASINCHQLRFEQQTPLSLGSRLLDHRVDHAVLVFQGQKGHAAGDSGSLSIPTRQTCLPCGSFARSDDDLQRRATRAFRRTRLKINR
jgi:hypothetical protein